QPRGPRKRRGGAARRAAGRSRSGSRPQGDPRRGPRCRGRIGNGGPEDRSGPVRPRSGGGPALGRARPIRHGALDELPGAHAPKRSITRAPRRDLGPHRLPDGAHRDGTRNRFSDRRSRYRGWRYVTLRRQLMKRRMLLMLAVMVVFIGTIGLVKVLQIRAAIAQGSSYQPPPEAVTTIVAGEQKWPATLNAIGTVAAVQGVTVSADLPGIVESIAFDSGKSVREGDLLVRLDTRQERAQLAAAEAQRDLANLDFERSRQLLQKGVIAQAEYDRLAAEAKQAEARVGEIRASIERKEIRAPFAGILGIRQVNLGQYLEGGAAVAP